MPPLKHLAALFGRHGLTPGGTSLQLRGCFRAGIAQLVERNLAKVEVASSSLVSRSNTFSLVVDELPRFWHSKANGRAPWDDDRDAQRRRF